MGKLNLTRKSRETEVCDTCGCGEFLTEFADEISLDNYTKGVTFRASGDQLKLTYSGLLAKSGAQEVFAAVGLGNNQNWRNTKYYPMRKVDNRTFEVSLPVNENENVNVAFKDNAENWDNNSGRNYSFYIH